MTRPKHLTRAMRRDLHIQTDPAIKAYRRAAITNLKRAEEERIQKAHAAWKRGRKEAA